MNTYFRYIIILILLAFWANGDLQSQTVAAELDSTHIMIGDQLKMYLKVYGAKDVLEPQVNLKPIAEAEKIELLEESEWQRLSQSGDVVFQKDLTVTSFDSGYHWIPSLSINYKQEHKRISKTTDKLPLQVETPTIDSLSIRPIKFIKEEPVRLSDFYGIIAGLGLFIIAGLGLYFYSKRKKAKEEIVFVPPPLPAHEIALSKLRDLENQKLWQAGEVKQYQSELTYIVREYLEKRYSIQALESTTDEIIKDLGKEEISASHKTQLADMFRMADMVKFAKASPPMDIQSKLLSEAEKFVINTKAQPIIELEKTDTE